MIKIIKVKPLNNFHLELTFNNGVVKEVDISKDIWGEVFKPLKDKKVFREVLIQSLEVFFGQLVLTLAQILYLNMKVKL